MSLSLSLRRAEIKDLLSTFMRDHSGEIVIVGITVAILVGLTVIVTGDVMSAIANHHRR